MNVADPTISTTTSRRALLLTAGSAAAAIGLSGTAIALTSKDTDSHASRKGISTMTIKMKDGTNLYYKDWGTGPAVVFSHGWPLTADAWDAQMLFLGTKGYRVIAHDRRGHGRSDQPWLGNDMDTYADDLATLLDALDIKAAVLIGHSTGGGEVARYIGRHGTHRVSKAVLISSVPPHMLQTDSNPDAAPMSVFDGLRAGLVSDRAGFFKNLAMPFFGYNRANAKVSQGTVDSFLAQGMAGSIKSEYDCIKAFSETDFTDDLRKMTIPTLVIQGDDDQIVPIGIASLKTAKIVPNAKLLVYPGAPHGLPVTHADKLNVDLVDFIKS
jgi:non-heme chloroperoxidase